MSAVIIRPPGEWRRSQNWIGGTSLNDAVFIPPHHDELPELLTDLEKFWHSDAIDVPHLVRAAISHYQFETIHPLLDGSGRMGRLLITLYLVNHRLLAKPCLYLSDHLERNKGAYYDALTVVRVSNDLGHWVKFFLQAVVSTAERGKQTFQEILKLKTEMDAWLPGLGRRANNAKRLLDFLYRRPFASRSAIAKELDISEVAAGQLIGFFMAEGLLDEITGFKRNRYFVFSRYYRLFDR